MRKSLLPAVFFLAFVTWLGAPLSANGQILVAPVVVDPGGAVGPVIDALTALKRTLATLPGELRGNLEPLLDKMIAALGNEREKLFRDLEEVRKRAFFDANEMLDTLANKADDLADQAGWIAFSTGQKLDEVLFGERRATVYAIRPGKILPRRVGGRYEVDIKGLNLTRHGPLDLQYRCGDKLKASRLKPSTDTDVTAVLDDCVRPSGSTAGLLDLEFVLHQRRPGFFAWLLELTDPDQRQVTVEIWPEAIATVTVEIEEVIAQEAVKTKVFGGPIFDHRQKTSWRAKDEGLDRWTELKAVDNCMGKDQPAPCQFRFHHGCGGQNPDGSFSPTAIVVSWWSVCTSAAPPPYQFYVVAAGEKDIVQRRPPETGTVTRSAPLRIEIPRAGNRKELRWTVKGNAADGGEIYATHTKAPYRSPVYGITVDDAGLAKQPAAGGSIVIEFKDAVRPPKNTK